MNQKRPFNLARIKKARYGLPEAFQVPSERGDPYAPRKPEDGKGSTLNKPGDEGLAGSSPQGTGFGTKERDGYPEGFSAFSDPSDKKPTNNHVPGDSDPDSPFGSAVTETGSEYGSGIETDNGLNLHDGDNPAMDDSALGRQQTVVDKLDGDRDRVSPYYNMNRSRPLFDRIRHRQKG